MIATLRGTVSYLQPPAKRGNFLVLEVSGVGYHVAVTGKLVAQVKVGQPLTLHTHLSIREDAHELFGFLALDELRLFELLIGVQRIGTRVALHLLDVALPEEIRQAVAANAPDRLSGKPGVAVRTAELVVSGLRGKIAALVGPAEGGRPDVLEEVLSVLLALGFGRPQIQEVISQVHQPGLSSEDIIRAALKLLGQAPAGKTKRP